MEKSKKIYASGEEYLKWILRLEKKLGNVRSIDLARHMGYSKPSISLAVKELTSRGYIKRDSDGFLHLTMSGRQIAESFNERHSVLTHLLTTLGVTFSVAEEDACRLEHVISEECFQKLKEFDMLQTEHGSVI